MCDESCLRYLCVLRQRPGLLDKRPDVRFALKCQEFIELVKRGDIAAAVILAQVLSPAAVAATLHVELPYKPGVRIAVARAGRHVNPRSHELRSMRSFDRPGFVSDSLM